MEKIASFYESGKRYRALHIIAPLFMAIGFVLLVCGALLLAFGLSRLLAGPTIVPPIDDGALGSQPTTRLSSIAGLAGLLSLPWSFVVLLSGVQCIALGSVCRLLVHLEENTRVSAQSLDKIRMRLESQEGTEPLFRS